MEQDLFETNSHEKHVVSRRHVLALMGTSGAVAAATILLSGCSFFDGGNSATSTSSPTTTTQAPTQAPESTATSTQAQQTGTVIGATSQASNSAKTFTDPANSQDAVLIHLSNGNFVAYDSACTHEGVTVNYDPATQKLVCPRHGAIFDPANGAMVLSGPAPSPLAKVTINVMGDGTITVG
ncbi:MAG TPA: Rieske (2Fe-2S) protein [Ktedonobacteraceae bacterium]|jgi:Rieske Fe-S protein